MRLDLPMSIWLRFLVDFSVSAPGGGLSQINPAEATLAKKKGSGLCVGRESVVAKTREDAPLPNPQKTRVGR